METVFITDAKSGPGAAEAWCWVSEAGKTRGQPFLVG